MPVEFGCDFRLRKWVHLLDGSDSDIRNLSLFSLKTKFVPDFSCAQQNPASISDFCIGPHTLEPAT